LVQNKRKLKSMMNPKSMHFFAAKIQIADVRFVVVTTGARNIGQSAKHM